MSSAVGRGELLSPRTGQPPGVAEGEEAGRIHGGCPFVQIGETVVGR
jgi:hypothetical protein